MRCWARYPSPPTTLLGLIVNLSNRMRNSSPYGAYGLQRPVETQRLYQRDRLVCKDLRRFPTRHLKSGTGPFHFATNRTTPGDGCRASTEVWVTCLPPVVGAAAELKDRHRGRRHIGHGRRGENLARAGELLVGQVPAAGQSLHGAAACVNSTGRVSTVNPTAAKQNRNLHDGLPRARSQEHADHKIGNARVEPMAHTG